MYKMDLALNNQQCLIYYKIKPNQICTDDKVLCSHIHEYGHVRNRHVMFITIEYIKNRNLKNT